MLFQRVKLLVRSCISGILFLSKQGGDTGGGGVVQNAEMMEDPFVQASLASEEKSGQQGQSAEEQGGAEGEIGQVAGFGQLRPLRCEIVPGHNWNARERDACLLWQVAEDFPRKNACAEGPCQKGGAPDEPLSAKTCGTPSQRMLTCLGKQPEHQRPHHSGICAVWSGLPSAHR